MTDDFIAKWELSRRRVLAGMGAVGASLAASDAFAQADGPWATPPKSKVDRAELRRLGLWRYLHKDRQALPG